MRVQFFTRFAAIALMTGALACARNTEDVDTDETAAARDTTVNDTLGGEAQNPPGYRGMERDTTIAPPDQQATDTFLQNQGTGQAQDTAGYGGLERVDTTGQHGQMDTTGMQGQADTTGWQGNQQDQMDTTGGAWGTDTTGVYQGTDTLPSGDTTGYNPSQQQNPSDTTSR
jgi:hypothetical protein